MRGSVDSLLTGNGSGWALGQLREPLEQHRPSSTVRGNVLPHQALGELLARSFCFSAFAEWFGSHHSPILPV
jgi:hypothetical protein